jgi:hypothetical protein
VNKSQFQTKAKELLKTGEGVCSLYKRIAKKTGYSVKTVERANGNGRINASKRFYEIFNSKYK